MSSDVTSTLKGKETFAGESRELSDGEKVIWVGVETKRGKSLVRVEEMDEGHWCERR